MVQSTVSTLGTVSIAANSIVSMLETVSTLPAVAVGLGLVTIAGQWNLSSSFPAWGRRALT